MRRRVGPVLGILLGGFLVFSTLALRSPEQPVITLQQARPNPIFPASLIPFSIGPEVCRNDHQPLVTMNVYNGSIVVVAKLTLRGKSVPLDGTPLKCGDYVAVWDGTVDGGRFLAVPAVYWVRLEVDHLSPRTIQILVPKL